MRLYLGHRLPFRFWGGIGIGPNVRIVHDDGTHSALREVPFGFVALCFLLGLVVLPWLVAR